MVKILATFLYVGYLPWAPGTFGSAAGLLLFYFCRGNATIHIAAALSLITLGLMVSGRAEVLFRKNDAPRIVIDEAAGMLVSLLFVPYDLRLAVTAFILFRAFDILKPFPIRKLQGLRGGIGIMSDDIAAAVYSNVLIQIFLRLASFKAS
ncbi:MAG: phosphatidylglycerophosphatase A [Candidatus Omnitrophica bacterium]|nr:phosphatidylglycerophosphatase A [Candidatus Omnitrophota bacterium]MDD5553993.1 phosphatidylglycerophosphatase A [Candidatus Omnitrophota bacterium]